MIRCLYRQSPMVVMDIAGECDRVKSCYIPADHTCCSCVKVDLTCFPCFGVNLSMISAKLVSTLWMSVTPGASLVLSEPVSNAVKRARSPLALLLMRHLPLSRVGRAGFHTGMLSGCLRL